MTEMAITVSEKHEKLYLRCYDVNINKKKGVKIMKKETRKYFRATLKGGHVGRAYYYPFYAFITANDKKEASDKCKDMPRVKKDHKDWMLELVEITYEEYVIGKSQNKEEKYLQCHNIQEQRTYFERVDLGKVDDPHFYEEKYNKNHKVSKKNYERHYKNDCRKKISTRDYYELCA